MRKYFLSLIAFFAFHLLSAQTVYTFQGNGNWSDSANWLNRQVPPTSLPKLDTVIVNPPDTGECILDEDFFLEDSASLQVRPGKKLRLLKGLASSQVELSNKLYVIDTGVMQLISDSLMLAQGIYEFSSADSIPNFAVGDFIAGTTGTGYIRKVTGVTLLRPLPNARPAIYRAILSTVQAALSEIVKRGSFRKSFPVRFVMPLPGFNDTQGPFNLQVTNANITFESVWEMSLQIADHGIKYFEMSTHGATLSGGLDVSATSSIAGEWATEAPLAKFPAFNFLVWIGALPVFVAIDADVILKANFKANNPYNRNLHLGTVSTLDLGVRYKNGNWTYISKASEPISSSVYQFNKQDRDAQLKITLGTELSARFEGVVGPYVFGGLTGEYNENFQLSSGRWDMNIDAYETLEAGVNVEVMDVNLLDLVRREWNFAKVNLFSAPDTVIKISGDNQSALFDEYLAQPLKVRVTDNFGNPLKDVPVYFRVLEGGGSVENTRVLTDANGYAQVRWRLGTTYGAKQLADAYVLKVDGEEVSKPVQFTAKTPTLVGSWKLKSFANGVLPGTFVDVYDSTCTNVLRYRYTELVDDFSLDSTNFSNYNEERVLGSGVGWDPQTCAIVSNGPGTDSTYRTTTAGTYIVTNNNVATYYVDGQEVTSYTFQFITFDRIKGGENEYERQ